MAFVRPPIRVDSQSCLSCHASVEDAPQKVTKIYGKNNGFGWKLNDIIGAQIVSVPAKLVNESAEAAVTRVLCWLAAGYALQRLSDLGVHIGLPPPITYHFSPITGFAPALTPCSRLRHDD
ncbi:MAG TPA: DUF3365 domain-containing protein [Chthoniobacterales bacterium]